MEINKHLQPSGSRVIIYFIIPAINFALLFFSDRIPFFGDDFAWLVRAKEQASLCIAKYMMLPAPFDYFRPVPKLFFLVMSSLTGSHTSYRIVIIILNVLCSFVIYKLCVSLKFSDKVSSIAALIFAVLSCHAEVLFFINCINEIFSALFILTGLLLISKKQSVLTLISAMFCFCIALLSRESAIVFVPLIFLINHRTRHLNLKQLIVMIALPLLIYFSLRFYSENFLQSSNLVSVASRIELNPVRITYKFVQYFLSMIFPVKPFFDLIGFEKLSWLTAIIKDPGNNIIVFSIMLITGLTAFVVLVYHFIKYVRTDSIFCLLFILFALSIYLLSFDTAERFLYLPSVGMSILIAVFSSGVKSKKLPMLLLIVFLTAQFGGLIQRSVRYSEAAKLSEAAMNDLKVKTSEIPDGSSVLLGSIPPKKFGIFFLSIPNLNSNWKYNFPERKIKFVFPGEDTSGVASKLIFDESKWQFVK